MPIVKNTSSQALYLNLLDGRTAKIPARGTNELTEADVHSPSVLHHLTRGVLVVVEGTPAPPAMAPFEKSLLSWETWEPEAQEPKPKRSDAPEEGAESPKEALQKRERTVSKSKQRRAKASSRKQQGEK
ncbi:MAG: hypothetical protein EHM23_08160 [Acidobacteria bacterium]|nr:MAG: hypothetical protein EHM23_08160 [Acidobacteriota bacterium]